MKPYFTDGKRTIYHGDCREILPTLPKCDVFITDPPYAVNFDGKETKHSINDGGYLSHNDESSPGPEVVKMCLSICNIGAVFTGIRILHDYPKPSDIGCVYCPSGAGRGPWGFCCMHPILYYGKYPEKNKGDTPSSLVSFATTKIHSHPCSKPLEWMQWLLLKVRAKETQTILDPFMGSGTTLRAAKDLNLSCIGIELCERYCEIAAKRLEQEVFEFEGAS